ncbi:MAG: S1 RNA-binding domain-containing protein [Geovibrio sp.]|nr:S1 RNA-binding domain-containing protein [Geovibrio sp.]
MRRKSLKIDPERERISLGLKQLEPNPWREVGKLLPLGKMTEVEITAVTKDGVTVSLPRDLSGFIPVSELDVDKIEPDSKFKSRSDNQGCCYQKRPERKKHHPLCQKTSAGFPKEKKLRNFSRRWMTEIQASASVSMLKDKLDALENNEE